MKAGTSASGGLRPFPQQIRGSASRPNANRIVFSQDIVVKENLRIRAATMSAVSGAATAAETSAEYQSLISYLPRYRRAAFDPGNRTSFPSIASAPAAVLRSDIVGFTLLTDQMVRSGIAGTEQLADVMNQIINRMAEIAWAQGGELVNWEGDAGTFVWFAREGLSLDDATVLAVQAALTIHREAETW
jgi:class 3 adenylate cyclase